MSAATLRSMTRWFVYLIECRDGSLYTGISTDVERRYAQHAAGKGARYTRSRPPVRLLARFEYPDRAAASRAEHAIKQLPPARKRALCDGSSQNASISSDFQ
jgi:putative endonuclease